MRFVPAPVEVVPASPFESAVSPDEDPIEVTRPSGLAAAQPVDGGASSAVFAPGEVIATRYRVDRLLGAGGMGAVYKVWDQDLDVFVALKVIRPEMVAAHSEGARAFEKRFKQEILVARQVTHVNVVRIFDLGETGGMKFITMAYVEGADLASILSQGALATDRALPLARQLASGLAAAHGVGVVHRDLKPQNLLVDRSDHLCISDFGLAKSLDVGAAGLTRTGEFLGTPRYLSPEQVQGKTADHRSDLYAMGLIFFEMVTGRPPFSGSSTLELMYQRVSTRAADPRETVPTLPAFFASVISKCLATAPDERYQSALQVLEDLSGDRSVAVVQPAPAAPAAAQVGVLSSRRVKLAAALVVLLPLATGLALIRDRSGSATTSIGSSSGAVPPPSERRLLAVLPFAVAGDAATLGYLAVGVGEALSAKLFQMQDLSVAAPAAVERADLTQPLAGIGRELGVNLILTGTVQGSRQRIRITARLEDLVSGQRVWTGEQSGVPDDLLTLEDQLYAGLADALKLAVPGQGAARQVDHPTENIAAYDLYLQGRNALRAGQDPKNVTAAIGLFEKAIGHDADFALAYTGIADASLRMYGESRDRVWTEKALYAADRARDLDDALPEVHFALGSVYSATGKTAESVTELTRAVELAPNSDEGYRRLGRAYLNLGRRAEAIEGFERAIAINPYYWLNHNSVGAAHLELGAYEQASQAFRRVIEIEPDNVDGLNNLGASYLSLGQYTAAIDAFQRALKIRRISEGYTNVGTALFYNGQYAEALPMFEKGVELTPNSEQWVGNLADGYRWAGQRDKALVTYDRAIALAYKELQVNPRNARVKRHMATYYAKKGDPSQARQLLDDALGLNSAHVNAFYTAAVVHTLANRQEDALRAIEGALQAGYPVKLIEDDPEFRGLRSQPRFAEIVKGPRTAAAR